MPIFSIKLKIAECSESTGRSFTSFFAASFFIRFPAITIVSLFAKARFILFSSTILEGSKPAAPAIPFTTISGLDFSMRELKACDELS